MEAPAIAEDEAVRLTALHRLQILDTEEEKEFNDIVTLASQICGTPISLITFVDEKRQWFKAKYGLDISETPREVSFCTHTVLGKGLMAVPNTLLDERFVNNPFVTGDLKLRFYAGIPLLTSDGQAIGTLCVIDQMPRRLDDRQVFALEVLAKNITVLLEMRMAKRESNFLMSALPVAMFRFDSQNRFKDFRTHNHKDLFAPAMDVMGKLPDDVLPPDLAATVNVKMKAVRELQLPERFEYSLDLPRGLSWFGAKMFKDANDEVVTIVQDITEHKKTESEKLRNLLFTQTITDNVPALISHWTSDLRNSFANQPYANWFGKHPSELSGMSLRDLVGDKIFQHVEPYTRKVLLGVPQDFQLTTLSKTGDPVHGRFQYIPFVEQDKVTGFLSLITDVTKLIAAEESAHREKELSDSIIQGLPGIFYLRDPNGKVLRSNRNFEIFSGGKGKEILPMPEASVGEASQQASLDDRSTTDGVLGKEDGKRKPYYINSLTVNYEGVECVMGIGIDISDRIKAELRLNTTLNDLRKTEAAFRTSEANIRTIFEHVDTAFVLLDENLAIVSFNNMAQLLVRLCFGKKMSEGDDCRQIFPAHDDLLKDVLRGKTSSQVANYANAPGNIWLHERYLPVKDKAKVVGAIVAFSDISAMKKAEAAIKENEQLLANTLNTMIGGVMKVDAQGNLVFTNQGAREILGPRIREVKTIGDFFDFIKAFNAEGKLLQKSEMPLATVLAQRKPQNNFLLGLKGEDNISKWLLVNASPIFYQNGSLKGAVCSFIDHTESIESQNKIRKISSRLMLAKKAADLGIWEWDIESGDVTWDDQMYEMTGVDRNEEVKIPMFQSKVYQRSDDQGSQLTEFEEEKRTKQTYRFVRRDNGQVRYLRTNAALQHDAQGKPSHLFGVDYDVTDIILHEQQLIEANKRVNEMQQIAMRAAMNPHFLYNALNSIQYYVTHNERLNAITYLSKFSKLMRAILDGSLSKTIQLSNELDILKLYIEIEQIRFSDKFDFILNLADPLAPENFDVPPLLIQPYVENAILHGLYNRTTKGLLRIDVSTTEDTLFIAIEDNGIGREAAARLKAKNFPTYESRGLAITRERMHLMDNGTTVDCSIEDLRKDGLASGTRVTITVK
jgi:PAS domain-containing protein